MKGIILAGGAGTRLYPASRPISKILLPVYDKPMIYYPLSVLMQAGIRDILIITTPEDSSNFKKLLGDGSNWGIKLSYKAQLVKRGIADAFLLGEEFIGQDSCALILGDNLFYGNGFERLLKAACLRKTGATVFAYEVANPQRFGVVEFDENHRALSLEEKPAQPKSRFAVTGLYFYDNNVVKYAKELKPSKRGELEITDLNKRYLEEGNLHVTTLERGFAWLDTGTHESVLQAANFVHSMQVNQGIEIACLEEIALHNEFITPQELKVQLVNQPNNIYYNFVRELVKEK
ncbi:glucose-1-phosphate thymidylyltransferase RfbA [Candidatus Avelusimicrobium luingense]|uniref:glucose-1-phosphate thymidylyltransferase RfbA n=1 Tax=Candidatus Avelusimicrobium luingense TaxID=3416211 RepID=UPI003D12E0C2